MDVGGEDAEHGQTNENVDDVEHVKAPILSVAGKLLGLSVRAPFGTMSGGIKET